MKTQAPPVKLFISYSHQDDKARKRLDVFLHPLEREGMIRIWHDRRLQVGKDWGREIEKNIKTAELIILLLSADFLASDYIYGIEMKIACERWQREEVLILPIVVRACAWESTWLKDVQVALNGKIVAGVSSADNQWKKILTIIRDNVLKIITLRFGSSTQDDGEPDLSNFRFIEKYVEDISASPTRGDRSTFMAAATAKFAENELVTRFHGLVQSVRQAIFTDEHSPVCIKLRSRLDELEQENIRHCVTVAIVGQVKAGKSTLLNSLLGEDLSPRDVDAKTAFPIRARFIDGQFAQVVWKDGSSESFSPIHLEQRMEDLRVSNQRELVREIVVPIARPLFKGYGWIELLDTPGFDGWRREDTDRSIALIQRSVAVILVYRHAQAVTESFINLVEQLKGRGGVEVLAICNIDPNFRDAQTREPDQFRQYMSRIVAHLQPLGATHQAIDLRAAMQCRLLRSESSVDARASVDLAELETHLAAILLKRDILSLRNSVTRLLSFCDESIGLCDSRSRDLRESVEMIEKWIKHIKNEVIELLGIRNALQAALDELKGVSISAAAIGGTFGGALLGTLSTLVSIALPIFWPVTIAGLGSLLGGGLAAHSKREKRLKFIVHFQLWQKRTKDSKLMNEEMKRRVAEISFENRTAISSLLQEFEADVVRTGASTVAKEESTAAFIEYSHLISCMRLLQESLNSLTFMDQQIGRSLVLKGIAHTA